MEHFTNIKTVNLYKLFIFSFSIAILTYGFSLINFSLSIDNEIPILPDYGMDLGRWGTNLIKYHLFKGHLSYFTLILSLFLFSLAAVRLANLFKFETYSAYFFCGLFITFPQISYQVVFSMMADLGAIGVLLSIFSVELFIKGIEEKFLLKKMLYFLLVALTITFALSIYQALILVPATILLILFFQKTFDDSFQLVSEIKNLLIFGAVTLASGLLYILSVKIICPPIEQGGYLSSYTSGDSQNAFSNFLTLLKKHLNGEAYYGEKFYLIVSILIIALIVKFLINKKYFVFRFLVLLFLAISPFIISYFITNDYHPPRLYLTSNLVFAFIIVFALSTFKIDNFKLTKVVIVLILGTNFYFITNLFFSVNRIYQHDKKTAENIDFRIQNKYPDFHATEKYVYFHGYFPYEYHQKFRLENSEIFGGSVFNWDNGNNYRLINFFRLSEVSEYKMIEKKEMYDTFKDSIAKMPIWPNSESIKLFNNVIVVKLGNTKGKPLPFE